LKIPNEKKRGNGLVASQADRGRMAGGENPGTQSLTTTTEQKKKRKRGGVDQDRKPDAEGRLSRAPGHTPQASKKRNRRNKPKKDRGEKEGPGLGGGSNCLLTLGGVEGGDLGKENKKNLETKKTVVAQKTPKSLQKKK